MGSKDRTFSTWSAVRLFCLVGAAALGGPALLAPDWLGQYVDVEVALTVAFLLLLVLPARLVLHLGGTRLLRSVRRSGRRAAKKAACAALPEWAEQHELDYEQASQPGEVGTVRGTHGGFKVSIDLEAGDVAARWTTALDAGSLDLGTGAPPDYPPGDLVAFDTGDDEFDSTFSTRLATEALAAKFSASSSLRGPLVALWNAHGSNLDAISVDEHGVVCFLGPDYQYDVPVVSSLLDAMVESMESVERELQR